MKTIIIDGIEYNLTPKVVFHEGDWITNGKLLVGQITSFDGEYYRYMCDDLEQPLHISNAHKWHLWTIQDAKDGDVLQLGGVTAIFQKYTGSGTCICYCSVCNGEFEIPGQDGEDNIYGCDKATPATKEQRDTLMKAMADAGWGFDFEKKELKKIDSPVLSNSSNTGKDEPTKWSEEDKKVLEDIEEAVINYWGGDTQDIILDWLKSLKGRVQPKQEWAEEDKKMFVNIKACLRNADKYYGKELDWLKSLRPQSWTKEDKERYISCLQRLGTGNPDQPETINSKWFKKHVYPQSRWKPSEELMNNLSRAANGASYHTDLLLQLYIQLKQL